jgi:hypothetical protein
MLGVIFFILRNEVEKLLGPSGWSHVLSVAKLPAKAYSPVADYPDSEAPHYSAPSAGWWVNRCLASWRNSAKL